MWAGGDRGSLFREGSWAAAAAEKRRASKSWVMNAGLRTRVFGSGCMSFSLSSWTWVVRADFDGRTFVVRRSLLS